MHHLNRLCVVLPEDTDELQPYKSHRESISQIEKEKDIQYDQEPPKKLAKTRRHRYCGKQATEYLSRVLHRFIDSKWITDKRRNEFSGSFHDTEGVKMFDRQVGGDNPKIFSYAELYVGTNGFSKEELLGSGGFGRVFRGVLPSDGSMVAVKCLVEKGDRFEKSFMSELMAVAHLRHRNLVRLRGWCVHEDQLLLVYDYMPNLSLDRILFKKQENSKMSAFTLDWERRRRIVRGLAAALFYLHEQLETQIIHRDVKTSNVMLDRSFNARLGDFGLARWLEHELEYQSDATPSMRNRNFRVADTTRIGGTIGYLPPESFQRKNSATAKSDVFSFGIVMLEVVSGRRAIDLTYPDDKIILLDWIRRLSDQGSLIQAGDTRIPDGYYRLQDMERLIHIGLLCTFHDPGLRPSMKWVTEALSGNINGKLPPLPSFQSHPLYISLSSSSDTSSTSATNRFSSSSNSTIAVASSQFVTANGETIYITAEHGNTHGVASLNKKKSMNLPMVETPRQISFEEIVSATNDFSEANRVAELDFGTAYHGFLENRHHVMIKRLGMKTCPALRVRFSNELLNLGKLRHRNLVQLRGWCSEHGEMLVVYDYVTNRLLAHLLFHHNHKNVLQWRYRYNIIKSLASAVLYLHEEWDEQVIHRNITSSAVILDQDMNPRLTCFALAEFLTRNEDGHHVVIDPRRSVCGIFGYMSPEYLECGEATTAADVYSFGVVILEVVTGHMAVDFRRPEVLLLKRVHAFEGRKRPLEELADWRLNGDYDHKELERLIKLGMACTRSDPELRPSMKQIVQILDGNDDWFVAIRPKKEGTEEWNQRNASTLSLVNRIQALGIQ